MFENLIGPLLDREGGYSDDPSDSGGETKFGITIAVARAFGYSGAMREMPRSQAMAIYRARYWDSLSLDAVAAVAPSIAAEIFDTGVNCGVDRAGTWLQRCLNVFNQAGTWYADIKVDGRVGPMTVAALKSYLARRGAGGEKVLLVALNALQGAHYIGLAEAREKDEAFVFGWIKNRVEV